MDRVCYMLAGFRVGQRSARAPVCVLDLSMRAQSPWASTLILAHSPPLPQACLSMHDISAHQCSAAHISWFTCSDHTVSPVGLCCAASWALAWLTKRRSSSASFLLKQIKLHSRRPMPSSTATDHLHARATHVSVDACV